MVSCKTERETATAKVKHINEEAQLHAKVNGKKFVISEASIRRDLRFGDEGGIACLPNEAIFEQLTLMGAKTTTWNEFSSIIAFAVICLATNHKFNFSKYIFESMVVEDEVVYEEMYDNVERAATTATSLDAKHERGIINHGDAAAQTRSEKVSKFSNDPPLSRVNTLGSRKDRLQLKEFIKLCTKLSDRVLDLETTKTAQAKEIANLKKRVKRLERKKKSISHGLKRLYKVGLSARVESSAEEESLGKEESSKQRRIEDIDADDNITLVNDQEMFDADGDLQGEEVVARQEKEVILKETQYVQNVVQKVIKDITTTDIKETVSSNNYCCTDDELTLAQALVEIKTSKPKAKGIIMQKHSETTTIPILPSKVQDKGKEKARLFMQFLDTRRKFFATKRDEEKRNIPPTKAQQRSIMCTYLKNMDGWKPNNVKNKPFAKIQVLFDKAMRKGNTFVDMDTEVVGSSKKDEAAIAQDSSSKRAGDDLEQENAKKQRVEKENDFAELKRCLEIVPDDRDDVTINATHLSIKSLTIVDYKIYKEGRKSYF
nr:hypothetical protein [Tanacetum cinerariifolium]